MSRVRFVGRTEGAAVPRFHLYGETASGDWFDNVDRCRANGWRIDPHSPPHFGQIVFVRGGAGLMTVKTDRRPFSSPSVLIVPVNTVHGFDYGMDSDGWVLTGSEPYVRNLLDRMPDLRAAWSEPRILSLRSMTRKHPIVAAPCDGRIASSTDRQPRDRGRGLSVDGPGRHPPARQPRRRFAISARGLVKKKCDITPPMINRDGNNPGDCRRRA